MIMNVRHRKSRRIGVPRGMLRHLSLQILKQKPMSGSEIVDQIENYTDWRPSPGSIYPLLSDLQEENLILPYEDLDPSLKRFILTESGLKLVNDLIENDPHLTSRQHSIRKMYWRLHMGMSETLFTCFSNLMNTIETVYVNARDNPEVSVKLCAALDSATHIIKEVEA